MSNTFRHLNEIESDFADKVEDRKDKLVKKMLNTPENMDVITKLSHHKKYLNRFLAQYGF